MSLPVNLQMKDQLDREAAFAAILVSLRIMAKNNRVSASEARDVLISLIGEEDMALRARSMFFLDWIDGRREA